MNQISRKMDEVADRPLKMDLQLFAGEDESYPNLEDTTDFRDDAKEFNAKMDQFVSDRAPKEDSVETKEENDPEKVEDKAETPEVAEPDQKPKQDSETNKAFQEMRKAREEAERLAKENEERAKRADRLIAEQYGHMGIYTVEQYEDALRREKEAEDNKRYEEAGLTPEEIEKIRKYDELQRETAAEKQQRQQAEFTRQWQKLYDSYPDLVESSKAFDDGKDPEWYTEEMKAEIARGASPLAAYRNAHFETILQKATTTTKEVAKQEALNQINSKDHIKANGTDGGDVDHVEIDEDTMRMYRALNKGKTDAQIRAWHKKNAMGG